MRIVTNQKTVKQKQRIAMWTSIGGLGLLVVAFVLSLPAVTAGNPTLALVAWPVALVGLLIATVGTYHVNRWVRPPRAHEALAEALKGLDNRHILYNYLGPVPHLLLSPRGLFALAVKRYDGPARYVDGKWVGKFSLRRLYGQGLTAEGLGNPNQEIEAQTAAVERWLRKELPDEAEKIPVASVAVFINPAVQLDAGDNPAPIATIKTVKRALQRDFFPGVKQMPRDAYNALMEELGDQAS
ncbi:MAG: NERD domain-containing protein [Ardenticatenaceae bacterium]|nr:NERD domain-containing protein [Ardenticatenaceae bacterium]HBY98060.1 hypothetical protein [Chloroflexota bacterium]